MNDQTTTYESTITYTSDAAGRVEEIDDSQTGSLTYQYDGFDRDTSETTSNFLVCR